MTNPTTPPAATAWRLPPNQNLIRRPEAWPVVGETGPRVDPAPWTVTLDGAVAAPQCWGLEALSAMPQTERVVDIHCVTRWSKLGCWFAGVRLMDLIEGGVPGDKAVSVRLVARSERSHDTSLSLADVQRHDPLVALSYNGASLPAEHGGPVRVVTPGKYFYKSLKWLERIEIRTDHPLGYWEQGPGYHDGADPWREERYVTGSVPPDLRARMIAQRRFGGRDLLGCTFDGEDLDGLVAKGATLRNTSFRNARLRGADFSETRLVNADLSGADLTGARFCGADVMGAEFASADLSDADFTDAEIFGASFVRPDGTSGARFNAATRMPEDQLTTLADAQADYVRRMLATFR